MRRLVLNIILRLGRYAVLPIVALAGALFLVWLMAVDRYTVIALVTAPIVLCATPAALALALGILLIPSPRDRRFKADEQTAPGLWSMWRELDRGTAGRTLVIDTNFNASILEVSRYAGLFKQHVTMTVGLPLLIILDARAIRAVVAHEVAHARLQHASGGSNLYDFIAASENVLYYADPERTITGRIADALLHALLEWLRNEHLALSRENEFHADRNGAEQVGLDEMARALMLVEACGARLDDLVYTPLEKEMLGAVRAPTEPMQRIFDQLEHIRASEQLAEAALAGSRKSKQEAESTHPPLGMRLANLGFNDMPPVDGVQKSAVDQLLAPQTARELSTRFDGEWRKRVLELVSVGV